jgi:hypothetical protein
MWKSLTALMSLGQAERSIHALVGIAGEACAQVGDPEPCNVTATGSMST